MTDKTLQNVHDGDLKTRFCPSPTGLLHLGNVRTALFNVLLAKKLGGQFLLRIEDTDRERSKEQYVSKLVRDLQWLGIHWQEGPDHDQGHGPYYQSARQTIYDSYYHQMIDQGRAYPCFCSEEELALQRKLQRAAGKPPRYPGTCAHLTQEEIADKQGKGLTPTLRFRVIKDEEIKFDDLVKGQQSFKGGDIGDFIIRRTNGSAPFMYCNAVDDALMGVTHVLRGEDHLTNTPRQIMILEVLGLPVPIYGHIALILGPDGAPLSKRHGSRSIELLSQEGYLPQAINNYLARLGHYYGHDELFSLEELSENFRIESLSKSPAKFNLGQLNYWQKSAIAVMDVNALWEWAGAKCSELVPMKHRNEFMQLVQPNICFPKEVNWWANIVFGHSCALSDEQRTILKNAGADYFITAIKGFDQFGAKLSDIIQLLKTTLKISGRALYQPLRIALTGQEHGPELAKILLLMDPQEVRRRLEAAQCVEVAQ